MAFNPNDFEPSRVRAGETVTWRRPDLGGDYPAATWSLKYDFVGQTGKFSITAIADPNSTGFLVALNPGDAGGSATWPAGRYQWQARVTGPAGVVYRVGEGELEVEPDLGAQGKGFDGRSQARRILEAIEAAIEGAASSDAKVLRITTAGGASREIVKHTKAELIAAAQHYRRMVEAEDRARDLKRGKGGRNFIAVRF